MKILLILVLLIVPTAGAAQTTKATDSPFESIKGLSKFFLDNFDPIDREEILRELKKIPNIELSEIAEAQFVVRFRHLSAKESGDVSATGLLDSGQLEVFVFGADGKITVWLKKKTVGSNQLSVARILAAEFRKAYKKSMGMK